MSFHLSTKIYVGEKIFLGQNVISCFLLIFLIKLQTNNENNLESKYLWWDQSQFSMSNYCRVLLKDIFVLVMSVQLGRRGERIV